jgi:(2S)-methylsuccinyl-CoA dehydrogenase
MTLVDTPARAEPRDSLDLAEAALAAVDTAVAAARGKLRDVVASGARVSNSALEAEQYRAHALAWAATYAESLRELLAWARKLWTIRSGSAKWSA